MQALRLSSSLGSVHISSVRKISAKSAVARRKAQQGWAPCEHFQRGRRVFEPKDCHEMNGEQTLAHFLRKIKIAVAIKILGRLNIFQWFV
jgi:hypothetical protein